MVSIWAQLIIVMVLLGNIVIQGCLSVTQSSTISNGTRDNEKYFEITHETLLDVDTTEGSNKFKGVLREAARKKGDGGESMMSKILPVLIIPFLVSSSLIPAMLLSIKFLMIKSAIIGKIAIILMLLNFFKRHVDSGGVYNHYPMDLAKEHYGYQGVEEPGVYVNKRKRRKRDLR